MDRRTFIKSLTVFVGGVAITPSKTLGTIFLEKSLKRVASFEVSGFLDRSFGFSLQYSTPKACQVKIVLESFGERIAEEYYELPKGFNMMGGILSSERSKEVTTLMVESVDDLAGFSNPIVYPICGH